MKKVVRTIASTFATKVADAVEKLSVDVEEVGQGLLRSKGEHQIVVYYETWTEEDAEIGETDDKGEHATVSTEPDEFDISDAADELGIGRDPFEGLDWKEIRALPKDEIRRLTNESALEIWDEAYSKALAMTTAKAVLEYGPVEDMNYAGGLGYRTIDPERDYSVGGGDTYYSIFLEGYTAEEEDAVREELAAEGVR